MAFVIGLAIGAALMGLALWLQHRGIKVKWYEWLLGGLGFVLAVWAINDFFGSMSSYNETAGRLLLLILGGPAVILLALAIFLPWWRIHRANKSVPVDRHNIQEKSA